MLLLQQLFLSLAHWVSLSDTVSFLSLTLWHNIESDSIYSQTQSIWSHVKGATGAVFFFFLQFFFLEGYWGEEGRTWKF